MTEPRRILVFTGDGKGKTTAALGLVLRSCGYGMRTLLLQFLKSKPSGEMVVLEKQEGLTILQCGRGFVPPKTDPRFAEHQAAAEEGFRIASDALVSGSYDFVALDEICGAVSLGLLDEDRVVDMIENSRDGLCIVLTGRGAGERLIALADTVTEMRCVKHAYQAGRKAQKGVEF